MYNGASVFFSSAFSYFLHLWYYCLILSLLLSFFLPFLSYFLSVPSDKNLQYLLEVH